MAYRLQEVVVLVHAASWSCWSTTEDFLLLSWKWSSDRLSGALRWSKLTLNFLLQFHAMVVSCRSGFLDSSLGLNPSQHLARLTQRLNICLADHTLLQVNNNNNNRVRARPMSWTYLNVLLCLQLRGSTLALGLLTLELESCCPDWLVLTIDLLRRTQVSFEFLLRLQCGDMFMILDKCWLLLITDRTI